MKKMTFVSWNIAYQGMTFPRILLTKNAIPE